MMEEAKAKGLTSEKMMWESVDEVQDMLCVLKMEHPHKYWKFIRKTHGTLYNGHYTEEFARHDVDHIHYTNKKGEKKEGEYWSVEQIEEATKGMSFPSGVKKWDKYVAFNAFKADTGKELEDAEVLKAGYLFYFADEDWDEKDGSATKIWDYMCKKYNK